MNEFDDVEAHDVEDLLQPQKRSHLSFRALLRLYLDPFALFKNANRGNLFNQRAAFQYNKHLRWILVAYMRRWLCIALACLLAMNPAAALAQADPFFLVPAVGLGILFSLGLMALALIGAFYFVLGIADESG